MPDPADILAQINASAENADAPLMNLSERISLAEAEVAARKEVNGSTKTANIRTAGESIDSASESTD